MKGILVYVNNINTINLLSKLNKKVYLDYIVELYDALGYEVIYILPDYKNNFELISYLREKKKKVFIFEHKIITPATLLDNPYIFGENPPFQEEDGILAAYIYAAEKYNISTIIRTNSIYPYIDKEVLISMVESHIREKADFTTVSESFLYASGFYPEIVELDALRIALEKSGKKSIPGKVTSYIKSMIKKSLHTNYYNLPQEKANLYRYPELRLVFDKMSVIDFFNTEFKGLPSIDRFIKWYKKDKLKFFNYPRKIKIQLCNAKKNMNFKVFKTLIESISYPKEVIIHLQATDGDTILHDDLLKILSFIKDKGMRSILWTHLTPNITIDHEKIWNTAYMVMVDIPESMYATQDKEAEDFWRRVNEIIKFRTEHRWPLFGMRIELSKGHLDRIERIMKRYGSVTDIISLHNQNNYAGKRKVDFFYSPPERLMCRKILNELFIDVDGNAKICEARYWEDIKISGKSIEEMWWSEPIIKVRKAQLYGNFCPDKLCEKCNMWYK